MTNGEWVETYYSIDNNRHSSGQLFIRDNETFEQAAKRRGLGEIKSTDPIGWSPPKMPSQWLKEGNAVQALHAVIWLGGIACRLGIYLGETLLEDGGIVHEMAHIVMTPVSEGDNLLMIECLEQFEANIPGFK